VPTAMCPSRSVDAFTTNVISTGVLPARVMTSLALSTDFTTPLTE
jgi:hypothetical protein